MKNSQTPHYIFLGVSIVGGIGLGVAYISEYIFELLPCFLCIYERVPYAIALLLGLLGWVKPKAFPETLILLLFCSFLSGSALSFYHAGVEHHIFSSLEICDGKNNSLNAKTVEELQESLNSTPVVRCDEVPFRFLSLSMTEYNLFLSLVMSAILAGTLIKLWKKPHRQRHKHRHKYHG